MGIIDEADCNLIVEVLLLMNIGRTFMFEIVYFIFLFVLLLKYSVYFFCKDITF